MRNHYNVFVTEKKQVSFSFDFLLSITALFLGRRVTKNVGVVHLYKIVILNKLVVVVVGLKKSRKSNRRIIRRQTI